MLPLLKSVVEELFAAGLVKAVFATETLALGINMPARSVVLEKLSKFNGIDHADLTAGEYTQLIGRAGRRGIDVEGHAVVLAQPGLDPRALGSLASRRTYPLRSSFRPTYNMTVNLLERYDLDQARDTLEMSFAQFQSDRSVVGLARRARELDDTIADYAKPLRCERGDVMELCRLRDAASVREKELARARSAEERTRATTAFGKLRPGDIVAIPGGRRRGHVVVVDVDRRALSGPVVTVIDTDGKRHELRRGDLAEAPAVIDRMKVPSADRLTAAKVRRDTGAALRRHLAGRDGDAKKDARRHRPPSPTATDPVLNDIRAQLAEHPCRDCPDLETHARWYTRLRGVEKERDSVVARIEGRTSSLSREFDRVCRLLTERGCLEPAPEGEDPTGGLRPTERGFRLRRLFSERDLLISECLEDGVWDDLDPAALAAIVSTVCYESRGGSERTAPEAPSDPHFSVALARTQELWDELAVAERRLGLDVTPAPDAGIAAVMHRWALGQHYASAMGGSDLPAGDFVRQCRQVIDLLSQLATMPGIGETAHAAITRVRRGFVSQELTA